MVAPARLFASISIGAAALLAVQLAIPSRAAAEKCDPSDPETCVGGPTGTICGGQGEPCCNSGPTVCGGDLECEGGVCVAQQAYHVICKPPSNLVDNFWATPGQAWNTANWICGWGNVQSVLPGFI